MANSRRTTKKDVASRPPATSPEFRETQVVSAAYDLAERQLKEGTASAQVITHFLKLGTERESLERDKLRGENELMKAKIDALASAARMEEIYENALKAMRTYSGIPEPDAVED
jgi:hypothetical protein